MPAWPGPPEGLAFPVSRGGCPLGPGDPWVGSGTCAHRPGLEAPPVFSKNHLPPTHTRRDSPPPSRGEGARLPGLGGIQALRFPKPRALLSGSSSLCPCRAGQLASPPQLSEPCLQTWIMKSKRTNCEYFVPPRPKVQAPPDPPDPLTPSGRGLVLQRNGPSLPGAHGPWGRGLIDRSLELGP